MILSNTAIFEALDDGRLIIDPEPTPRLFTLGGPPSPYDSTSVNLRLSPILQIPVRNLGINIDLRRASTVAGTISRLSDMREIDDEQGFTLEPEKFVLARTIERVALLLPDDYAPGAEGKPCLAARVEGKSSLARFGILVHFTAPTIHADWDGPITLEIMNLGSAPFVLTRGMQVCQLIVEVVEGIPSRNDSQFRGQQTPAGN